MYQITFYVPETHLEPVKEAMFSAGAGQIGNYTKCAWQIRGTGQFLPQEGSDPFIGMKGKLTTVEEFKVEMVCSEDIIQIVINALKLAHPYEAPAYQIIPLVML